MGLFVALYFILLAFFIVLNSVAKPTDTLVEGAIKSVNKAFEPSGKSEKQNIAPVDGFAGKDKVTIALQRAFQAEFKAEGRFSTEGGNVFQVEFSQEELFEKASFTVRPDMKPFLDQLVDIVMGAPEGSKQEVAFMFGTGKNDVRVGLTRSQEFAIRRAGSLARYLKNKGLGGGLYSTGFTNVGEGTILAVFRSALNPPETLGLGG